MAALRKEIPSDIQFPSLYEHSGYLKPERWGTFTILSRGGSAGKVTSRTEKLHDLPMVLEEVTRDRSHDYWITQASFKGFNRRKVSLASIGTLFVDLDYYKISGFCHLSTSHMVSSVLRECEKMAIPEPSVIVDSGRGLQIKWFHEQLPKAALAKWDAMQRQLVTRFEHMGGDHHARDVSRVLRVVNSVHQETNNFVRLVYINNRFEVDEPVNYKFSELASAILPERLPSNDQIIDLGINAKPKKASVSKISAFNKTLTYDSLNWNRLCDLQNLINLRGGDVGDGLREPMAFYLCNFYGLRYYKDLATRPLDDWNELRSLCHEAAPHWTGSKIRSKTGNMYELIRRMGRGETVEFNGKDYPPLYTPRNDTLVDVFQITPEEMTKMATIMSSGEKSRRNTLRMEKTR